jgi:putative nucleotidyltransferase with HDIG domain
MLKKIAAENLKSGMYLQSLCGSWIDHPFWRSKFVVNDPNDIRLIIESGISEVWIDVKKGMDLVTNESDVHSATFDTQPISGIASKAAVIKPASMSDEMQRAAKICVRSKTAVMSMFQEVRMGKAIDIDSAGKVVQEIAASVMRNPGALISLARLKTADDYTYMHSVAVCALMVALARQLNFDEEQTREAGMAGLLHDLGKVATPTEVLNKPGRLTTEEFDIIKDHPVAGHKLLTEGAAVSEIAMDVCLHHHERIDGSGYPHGLKGDQISIFAKMGAVCDVYDAITSNRPYKAGWDPAESIKKMTEWSDAQYDHEVFQSFIRSVGIYPVGSLVMLSSGRLGVVMEQSAKSVLTPKVKVFFSTKSQIFITPQVIDLSRPTVDCKGEKIEHHEDPKKWNFKNFDQMWAE